MVVVRFSSPTTLELLRNRSRVLLRATRTRPGARYDSTVVPKFKDGDSNLLHGVKVLDLTRVLAVGRPIRYVAETKILRAELVLTNYHRDLFARKF
jgi:hypothetical protein